MNSQIRKIQHILSTYRSTAYTPTCGDLRSGPLKEQQSLAFVLCELEFKFERDSKLWWSTIFIGVDTRAAPVSRS